MVDIEVIDYLLLENSTQSIIYFKQPNHIYLVNSTVKIFSLQI